MNRSVIGAVLWLAFSSGSSAQEDHRDQQSIQAADKAGAQQAAPPSRPVAEHPQILRDARGQQPCYPPYEDRSNPLCAEWKAADAATTAAVGSSIAALFSVASIAALLVTIAQGRRALRNATEANRTAEKALRQAEISTERQLRAYVAATKIEVAGFCAGRRPRFTVTPENVGATPAKRLKVVAAVLHAEDPERHHLSFRGHNLFTPIDLGTKQPVFVSIDFPFTPTAEELASFRSGSAGCFVFFGYITYRDVFGRQRRTIFRNYLSGDMLSANGASSLRACRKGNRST